ncbi:MAG: adenylosuccinate synthase [Candidatus Aminicenantaceae bacterium]
MANLLVLGTQWGDEGKGKIIDLLAPSFDVVARYQGGHNAGHTVWINERKIILHLIPSGILHPDKLCIIGNGVVIDPKAFLEEVEELKKFGVRIEDNLIVSKGAHLILPYHSLIEKISEERRGAKKIGTTCRGIGPSYEDKVARRGLRVGDLLDLTVLKEKIEANVEEKNIILDYYRLPLLNTDKIYEEYVTYASSLKKYIKDVSLILDEKIKEGKSVLFEGAQGTLLDIDHGTYPYVTSSNSTAGGVCVGLGIGPDKIDTVLGVTKAYTTRVGGGPFPTEIFDEKGRLLLKRGNEYGATTGRSRRCGWFDAVAVSYSCRLNGISKAALTKPDVLDGMEEIKVCVGYKYKGELLSSFPTEAWILEKVVPQYKIIRGWKSPTRKVTAFSSLPQEFKDYITLIEDLIRVKVSIVSTGMERRDTIVRESELNTIVDLKKIKNHMS